jgi:surface polysaccharide O-acyltransferase-like enzyme
MNQRVYWLDAARAIAILLVVFTHCHEQAQVTDPLWGGVFYAIDRLGVPVFFMLSGGLILDKIKNIPILDFYKHRVIQFIVVLCVYSILTNTIKLYLDSGDFFHSVGKSIVSYNAILNPTEVNGVYGYARQLWYMYAIIQLYLVAPFVSRLVTASSTKHLVVFLILCAVFNQLRMTGEFFGMRWDFLNRLGSDFTGSYVFYFVLGYVLIARNGLNAIGEKFQWPLSILLIAIPSILLVKADVNAGKLIGEMHWYTASIFILASSIGLMMMLKLMFSKRRIVAMEKLSLCSFGIFLSHYAFIYIAKHLQQVYSITGDQYENTVMYFAFALTASLIFTLVMLKTKVTRYLVA